MYLPLSITAIAPCVHTTNTSVDVNMGPSSIRVSTCTCDTHTHTHTHTCTHIMKFPSLIPMPLFQATRQDNGFSQLGLSGITYNEVIKPGRTTFPQAFKSLKWRVEQTSQQLSLVRNRCCVMDSVRSLPSCTPPRWSTEPCCDHRHS